MKGTDPYDETIILLPVMEMVDDEEVIVVPHRGRIIVVDINRRAGMIVGGISAMVVALVTQMTGDTLVDGIPTQEIDRVDEMICIMAAGAPMTLAVLMMVTVDRAILIGEDPMKDTTRMRDGLPLPKSNEGR